METLDVQPPDALHRARLSAKARGCGQVLARGGIFRAAG